MNIVPPLLTRRLLKQHPVAVVAIAQLLGTSIWFSANSAATDLVQSWGGGHADIGWLTSAVQAGFILGTLAISVSGVADRYRPSTIFAMSAIAGALANAGFAWIAGDLATGLLFRFMVGLSLGGVYPIGMKLIVSWAPRHTGQALALLVAMLTLGTALPHMVRHGAGEITWQWVVTSSSVLSLIAAALVTALGSGPHISAAGRSGGPSVNALAGLLIAFRTAGFRAAAFGYYGHMWELYAFWTIVPLLVEDGGLVAAYPEAGIAGLSFCIIAAGAIGCIAGGRISVRTGSAPIALGALSISGLCMTSFLLLQGCAPPAALLAVLVLWGATVIADSPHFSALAASNSPSGHLGGVLAFQNAVGFAITIVAIAAVTNATELWGSAAAWLLLPGPIFGIVAYIAAISRRG